jgi:hypothetical protein
LIPGQKRYAYQQQQQNQEDFESSSSSQLRPITLELPRPLRSSLKKYNYSYSPGPSSSSRSGSTYSWAGSGTITNLETPPDSLSEDSSYVSAKDSSFNSINSQQQAPPQQNRVRFSPITLVGSTEERMENLSNLSLNPILFEQ